jgi:hypothetical protein
MFGSAKVGGKVRKFAGKTTTNPCKSAKGVQSQRHIGIKRNEKD